MSNAPSHVFAKGVLALGAKLENLPSDALKCLLLTNAYNPSGSQATAEYVQDLITAGAAEVSAGGGYSTGGAVLSSVTWTATAANSWSVTAATTFGYKVGDIVKPSGGNGYLYQCVIAGTSGGSAPTWPTTIGTTVTDGTVTWLNIGTAVTVLSSATITFTSSGAGFTSYYGVVYDSTPGAYSSDPVVSYFDFGGAQAPSGGGTLTIAIPTSGILAIPTS